MNNEILMSICILIALLYLLHLAGKLSDIDKSNDEILQQLKDINSKLSQLKDKE